MLRKAQIKIYKSLLFWVSLSLFLCIWGCSVQDKEPVQENDKLKVVTTTTMLRDLMQVLGGDQLDVSGLMGVGIDPHLYQASAGDITKMQEADIVVYNGIHLEGKMGEIFQSLEKQNKIIICAEDGLETTDIRIDGESDSAKDPHIWFDVALWMKVAEHAESVLATVDAENAKLYEENLRQYMKELEALDQYIEGRVAEVPKEQRILITAHDAFGYFGDAYDFEVKGLQGMSTEAEAGSADVRNLVQFIVDHKIKALFIESSIPAKNIEALQESVRAKNFDVVVGGELYSDSLGDQSHGHDTYIATCKANIDTIVNALK